MNSLKNKWCKFGAVVFGPGSLTFLTLALITLIVAYFFRNNIALASLLAIIANIFTGIAGTFINDDYKKISGENILEKKGRSALRTLNSLRRHVERISSFLNASIADKKDINKQLLEEVRRHISVLEDNISSSVEDWVDVVPELKETMQEIREINKLAFEIGNLREKEVAYQNKEEKNAGKISKLQKEISQKENSLRRLKEKNQISPGKVFLSSAPLGGSNTISFKSNGGTIGGTGDYWELK